MKSKEHNEEYFYLHERDVFSLQSLLVTLGLQQQKSIYKDSSNDFIHWLFSAADFFELVSKKTTTEVQLSPADKAEIDSIDAEITGYKSSGDTISHQERIKELRSRKKQILSSAAVKTSGDETAIVYKSFVEINDSVMVQKKLPQFSKVRWPYKEQMPYFTAGLESFAEAVAKGEPTAITGGPCFFGEHEVDMIFTLSDGSKKIYDFTTRRRKEGERFSEEAEFTRNHADQVADVSFVSHKTLLTTEEYDSILYLFELAKATNSCLTLPIVDASYEKYLDAMLESLGDDIRRKAVDRFRQVARPIIDMYLDLFEFFKKKYPVVKCLLMHGDDKEKLDIYYEKRTPFVEKNSTRRIISGIKEKIESVKDYITLPALPYYFWGIRNVLEVDYLGETDSFWKCRKMHKGEMKLSALLYPIKISSDGWRTIFSTDLEHKEYITKEDYGKR